MAALTFQQVIPKPIREVMVTALIGWFVSIDDIYCVIDGYNAETGDFTVRRTDDGGTPLEGAEPEPVHFDKIRSIVVF
jgi:hypothetical protein